MIAVHSGYRGRNKPPLGSQIDYSHPLAQGLIACWLMTEGGGAQVFDLAGALSVPLSGSPDWSSGLATATSSQYGQLDWPTWLRFAMPLSVVWQGRSLGTPDAFGGIAGVWDGSGGSPPYAISYDNATPRNLLFRLATTSTSNNFSLGPMPSGTVQVAGCYGSTGGTNNPVNCYLNGIKATSSVLSGGAMAYGSSPQLAINRVPGFTVNANVAHDLLYIYATDLSAMESVAIGTPGGAPALAWLYEEPYAFIRPPMSTRYVFLSPAAVRTASSSSSATFSDSGVASEAHAGPASGAATFSDSGAAHRLVPGIVSQSATFNMVAVATRNATSSAVVAALFSDAASATLDIPVSAADGATFRAVAGIGIDVAAADSARFTGTSISHRARVSAAADTATFYESIVINGVPVHAVGALIFSDEAVGRDRNFWAPAAADTIRFKGVAQSRHTLLASPSGPEVITFTDLASATRILNVAASSSAIFSDRAITCTSRPVSAADSATFTDIARSNHFYYPTAADGLIFTDHASVAYVPLGASDLIIFTDRAIGENVSGSMKVLAEVSGLYPCSYAESSEGLILIANGLDPMIAWDGVAEEAWHAGVAPPDVVAWAEPDGHGLLTGVRYAFVRWIDGRGNVSNLGPVSDPVDLGRDGFVEGVTHDDAGAVTIRSRGHGLSSGDVVIVAGVDDATTGGVPIVNGQWTVAIVDADSFTLAGAVALYGHYKAGGIWTKGSALIVYNNIRPPTDARIVRRQILRNLEGNANVLYVDIDTTDLVSTTFSSGRTDEDLSTSDSVPLKFEDGEPASQRYHPPPSHKLAVASYAGRIWAAADLIYADGNVQATLGSQVVVGLGTSWTADMAGRLLYVEGQAGGTIASVNPDTQVLVLDLPYAGPSRPMAFYAIRPAPIERRLVYFSEPGLPEAWPPWNAFALPESNDEVVGLFVLRSFLYAVKERNLYKFSYRQDPGSDGYVFPVASRGCINNRCHVQVEATYYLLDEQGIYSFDGESVEPISQAVSALFKSDGSSSYRVDWSTDRRLWSAAHDPIRQSIRWFVDLAGQDALTFAICYDYRRGQWWLERYPEGVSASGLAVLSGYRQSVVGTTVSRVFCLGQGTLDGVAEDTAGTLRGTATSGDVLGLADDAARFPGDLAGVPVAFVSGAGAGQAAIVSDNTVTTITFVDPVAIPADDTTVYQVGGVAWLWRSGWRQVADDEADNPRDLEFVFKPTATPSTIAARVYHDHADTPETWPFAMSDRDGITVIEGDANLTIDLSSSRGYAIQRMSGHRDPYGFGHRYTAVELHGTQGVEPQRVFRVVMNGVE